MNEQDPRPRREGLLLETPLPIAALLPGMAQVFILCICSLFWGAHLNPSMNVIVPILYGLLPFAAVLGSRRSLRVLGLVRQRALLDFGWGLVWGGCWRAFSLALNAFYFIHIQLSTLDMGLAYVVILIPWLEEIFFRGYLGRGVCALLGRWPGILIQALAFTLLPAHWSQGMPHTIGIFIFGILTGWLVERNGSIWPAIGAHSFANALPTLIAGLSLYS
ncbi:MAG: CPBP family intramembrane metalloprotease [Anaerolineales bacterium]|nr:CPBP family intramembrane metalloprotease [Anaerolineales bacterium]